MGTVNPAVLADHALWEESRGQSGTRLNLSGGDLRGADLRGASLNWAVLPGANLTNANLEGAFLNGADLSGSVLTGANLSRSYLTRAQFGRAILVRANMNDVRAVEADFSSADLAGADLSFADLFRSGFTRARLSGSILRQARCMLAVFDSADLSQADLSRAYFGFATARSAIFDGAVLTETDLPAVLVSGARFDVSSTAGMVGSVGFDADRVIVVGDGPERETAVAELVAVLNQHGAQVSAWLSGQERPVLSNWRWNPHELPPPPPPQAVTVETDALASHAAWVVSSGREGTRLVLHNVDLSGNNMRGPDGRIVLAGADLTAVVLDGMNLAGADLRAANLTHAGLRGAVLSGADLTGADLTEANLDGAVAVQARLVAADLSRAWAENMDLPEAGTGLERIAAVQVDKKLAAFAEAARTIDGTGVIEYATNSPEAALFLEGRMKALGIRGYVIVVP